MSELPPIPEAEFSPAFHQYFVKFKEVLTGFITSTNERLASLEKINDEDDDVQEESIPIGSIVGLVFARDILIVAGTNPIINGSDLRHPALFGAGWNVGEIINAGQWQLVSSYEVDITPDSSQINLPPVNFRRIS